MRGEGVVLGGWRSECRGINMGRGPALQAPGAVFKKIGLPIHMARHMYKKSDFLYMLCRQGGLR